MTSDFDRLIAGPRSMFCPGSSGGPSQASQQEGLLERLGSALFKLDSRLRGGASSDEFSDLVRLKVAVVAAISVLKASGSSDIEFWE